MIYHNKNAILISLSKDIDEILVLLKTLGYSVKEIFYQQLNFPDPKTYIGKGKSEIIRDYIINNKNIIDIVVINGNLHPSQHYNLERLLNITVYDRLRIILEIFMLRAHNKEAILQVELAKYQYELPFVREWIHHSKVGEHPGFMAGGGFQTDQYLEFIRKRISKINKDLIILNSQKELRRKNRKESKVITISIAGYTNAGKSSLFNIFTETKVKVADEYFTTLEPITRKTSLNNILKITNINNKKSTIVFTDTIGLIKNVPPWLIVSFRSTLDEIRFSNYILLILDVSDSIDDIIDKYNLAYTILINPNQTAMQAIIYIVLNKIDKITKNDLQEKIYLFRNISKLPIFPISTLTGQGIINLAQKIYYKN